MKIRELRIHGAYEITTARHSDDRGAFWEWYRFDLLADAVGHPLDLQQANGSISRRGVVRGIHYADVPPSQAKYVTVTRGAITDYVVDIRSGSPTFGQWEAVTLDSEEGRALYLEEGLGHAFVALEDNTTVTYLVSSTFNPVREHGINPLDPEVGLAFPIPLNELSLSPKDLEAPSLADALAAGMLPEWKQSREFVASLNREWHSRQDPSMDLTSERTP